MADDSTVRKMRRAARHTAQKEGVDHTVEKEGTDHNAVGYPAGDIYVVRSSPSPLPPPPSPSPKDQPFNTKQGKRQYTQRVKYHISKSYNPRKRAKPTPRREPREPAALPSPTLSPPELIRFRVTLFAPVGVPYQFFYDHVPRLTTTPTGLLMAVVNAYQTSGKAADATIVWSELTELGWTWGLKRYGAPLVMGEVGAEGGVEQMNAVAAQDVGWMGIMDIGAAGLAQNGYM